eukprot:7823382-Karenia_brevis.AAC.1
MAAPLFASTRICKITLKLLRCGGLKQRGPFDHADELVWLPSKFHAGRNLDGAVYDKLLKNALSRLLRRACKGDSSELE